MSLSGYAQNEFSSKFKPIPLKNNAPKIKKVTPPKAEIPPIKTPNVFKNPELLNPNPSPSLSITPTSNFSMTPKNEFINPGDVYRDKLNKKEDLNSLDIQRLYHSSTPESYRHRHRLHLYTLLWR